MSAFHNANDLQEFLKIQIETKRSGERLRKIGMGCFGIFAVGTILYCATPTTARTKQEYQQHIQAESKQRKVTNTAAYNATRTATVSWYEVTLLTIKKWEGFDDGFYKCSAGVKTIGWGLTEDELQFLNKQFGTSYTMQDFLKASPRLHQDFLKKSIEYRFKKYRIEFPFIEASEMGALISLSYNCGDNAVLSSSLKNKLKIANKSKRVKACEKVFLSFSKVNGKVNKGVFRRRKFETKLLKGDFSPYEVEQLRHEVAQIQR